MLQLGFQLPLAYPQRSSLAGEAEALLFSRVRGSDGSMVL